MLKNCCCFVWHISFLFFCLWVVCLIGISFVCQFLYLNLYFSLNCLIRSSGQFVLVNWRKYLIILHLKKKMGSNVEKLLFELNVT